MNNLQEEAVCQRCDGMEIVINPEYLVWEQTESDHLPLHIQNDQRRYGSISDQGRWDDEVDAPPRYLPCPECGGLDNCHPKTPLATLLEKSIEHELAKQAYDDSDIVLHGHPGGPAIDVGSAFPIPATLLAVARDFGRRHDREGFRRWLSANNSDLNNWNRLQDEYQRGDEEFLPAWTLSWIAIARYLPTSGLEALQTAIETDDPKLIQGATTSPPSLQCVQDWPVECACGVAYAIWKGYGLNTVADVEQGFARVCCEGSVHMGEPAGFRYFLTWFDETPRDEMRRRLLPEVKRELARRGYA